VLRRWSQKIPVLFHDGNSRAIEALQMSLEHGFDVTGKLVDAMLHPDHLLLHRAHSLSCSCVHRLSVDFTLAGSNCCCCCSNDEDDAASMRLSIRIRRSAPLQPSPFEVS